MDELDSLITNWLPLPDIAERLDLEVSRVRRLIEEGQLIAVRRGDPVVRMVPELLIGDGETIPHLPGTITILRDGGFDDAEVLTWLFTEDETLPGRTIDQLRKGQRGEVRRRALALALCLRVRNTAASEARSSSPISTSFSGSDGVRRAVRPRRWPDRPAHQAPLGPAHPVRPVLCRP